MSVEPGACLGHYRLLEKLAAGGMGVVWKALDLHLEREVALKLLPDAVATRPEALARLEHEARAVAALNHPNIVTLHSVDEADGVRFITMEMIGGCTLREAIPAGGFPLERLFEVALAIVDALGAAHARGIVHRDLKPANVMITANGQVKVLDFGLAVVHERPEAQAEGDWATRAPTAEDALAGTLHYMSPEQLRGRRVDPRSDIFAFGVLLYQMSTGRRPFEGETLAALAAAILTEVPVPPSRLRPDLPRGLDEIVGRCLEKEPELRLPSAAELRALLAELRRETPAAAGASSIAVLPFADMSPGKDHGWFCEGLAEEVINALAQLERLRVASRVSAFQFRGAPLGSREIGRRLGVRHLLEGSVRRANDRLRITTELSDVEAGFCLWSERFDREMKDVFAIQEEIARNVAAALRLTLDASQARALARTSTDSVQAYEFYLRGRTFYHAYNRRGVELASQMFRRAIEADSGYALAHAGLADCCTFLFMHVMGQEPMRGAAIEAGRRAVALDPGRAECHVSLGLALSLTRDHAEAEREFETALRLDERSFEAHYFFARDLFMRERPAEALAHYERASALRPEDWQAPLLMAQLYQDLGRNADAEAARRAGVRAAGSRLALQPDDVRALYMGANGLVALGERERGLEWAQRALRLDPGDAMLLYNLACIYAMAGRGEEAIDFLERSVRAGMNRLHWLLNDSNLESIRSDPRFAAVVHELEAAAAGAA